MLKINLMHKDAKMPTRAYKGDVGLDCYAVENTAIPPRGFGEIKLGIALDIPEGYWVHIQTRSSIAKRGVQMHGGVIDEGFKGELSLFTFNHSDKRFAVEKGDKVCQLILHKVYDDGITPLLTEARGDKGYGSSNHV
jgi:dUTP pyrophosphatase